MTHSINRQLHFHLWQDNMMKSHFRSEYGFVMRSHECVKQCKVLVSADIRWGTRRTYRTVLRPGLQRGMMGSNNHIITNSASDLSDVRGIKEARRVHAQAASLRHCRTLSHMWTCSRTYAQTFICLMKHNHTFWKSISTHTHTYRHT